MTTGKIKSFLVVFAGLLTVSLSIYLGWGISNGLRQYADNLGRNRDNASPKYLVKAEFHESIGDEKLAFWNLQMAVANAVDNTQKSIAAMTMAEFLLRKAGRTPMPYALMGKQYCEAVLDIETDKKIRYRACKVMVELAGLLKDPEVMEEGLQEGVKNAPTREDASVFLVRKLEVLLDAHQVEELEICFDDIKSYFDVPGVRSQVVFMKNRLLTVLHENVDTARKWFGEEDLIRRQSEYTALAGTVEQDLENIIESGSAPEAAEAIYHLACTKMLFKDFSSAQTLFEKFLMTESNTHQADVLMRMAQIARHEGKVGRAERMLDVFVKRFSWNKTAAKEFLTVVMEIASRHRYNDALKLIDKYLDAGLSGDFEAKLLRFAAKTSMDAGLTDRAKSYYSRLYDLHVDDEVMIESLLVRGGIYKEEGEYKKAMSLLLEYLVSYPYEAKRGDAYFDVFEMERRSAGISPATLISIASAAALEKPDDPRTKEVLLDMAGILEKMELHEMARDRYGRIALLHYVSDMQGSISVSEGSLVYAAMLGAGRCYYRMGEFVQADTVFRDLCNSMPSSKIRSEAAYYWAQIAIKNGQIPEAKRRLGLMGDDVDVLLKAKSKVDMALIAVKENGCNSAIYESLVDPLAKVEETERLELWRKFAFGAMDEIERDGDVKALEEFFTWASDKDRTPMLPLRDIHMRTASMLISKRGVDEYGAFLRRTKQQMSADADYGKAMNAFMDLVDNIDDLKLSRDAVL